METRVTLDKFVFAINGLRTDLFAKLDKIEDEQTEFRKEQTEIRKDFKEFKKYVEMQFDAVRQGLVQNYQETLQTQKEFTNVRLSVVTIKSISEVNERIIRFPERRKRVFCK
ncbi:MAG TPA: hypothetical protein PKE69_22565 [Pyrinomonadaceae bacterium]|nr:hypothetical protein [Pyrinomonadaceae bacterium]